MRCGVIYQIHHTTALLARAVGQGCWSGLLARAVGQGRSGRVGIIADCAEASMTPWKCNDTQKRSERSSAANAVVQRTQWCSERNLMTPVAKRLKFYGIEAITH